MTNQSDQQAQLSWLQSSSGEWLYFLDENLASEDLSSVVEQDYMSKLLCLVFLMSKKVMLYIFILN